MATDTKIPDELEAAKFARRIMLEDRQRGFGVYAQLSAVAFNYALGRAAERIEDAGGCRHCGDVSSHPEEARDVCPAYERYVADQ